MRARSVLMILLLPLAAGPARAQGAAESVTACDTLIAARRIDAAPGRHEAGDTPSGCRRLPRSAVGDVERRAMIGGAPYECLAVAGAGGCLWIVP